MNFFTKQENGEWLMTNKKNETRFHVKFNPENPRHNEAIEILNKHGRGMASLIADALCMYVYDGAICDSSHKESVELDKTFLKSKPMELSQDDFRDTLNNALDSFF